MVGAEQQLLRRATVDAPREVDERKINQGTRLTNRSFEWKMRELIVHCLQADDDDNKKIYRLTSMEKTVRKCQVSGNSHQESRKLRRADKEQNAAEAKRAIEAQKPIDSYNEAQKVDNTRKCRSSTGGKPTMLTMWPRRRRLKLTRPQQKK